MKPLCWSRTALHSTGRVKAKVGPEAACPVYGDGAVPALRNK